MTFSHNIPLPLCLVLFLWMYACYKVLYYLLSNAPISTYKLHKVDINRSKFDAIWCWIPNLFMLLPTDGRNFGVVRNCSRLSFVLLCDAYRLIRNCCEKLWNNAHFMLMNEKAISWDSLDAFHQNSSYKSFENCGNCHGDVSCYHYYSTILGNSNETMNSKWIYSCEEALPRNRSWNLKNRLKVCFS